MRPPFLPLMVMLVMGVGGGLAHSHLRQRVPPRKPEEECAGRGSRNRYRELVHKGCMERATEAWVAWRKKCKAVAVDAEQRAVEMVMELAADQERKVSDRLIDEAAAKRQRTLDDILVRFQEEKRQIPEKCKIQGPALSDDAANDCVNRLTEKATADADRERSSADNIHNSDLDTAVKRAEEKKLQIIAGMTKEKRQAREMVLADCSKYLS